MSATQKKILGELKKITEEAGCELVRDPDWANTGEVRVVRDWTPLLGFYYEFQSSWGYMTLQFYPGYERIQRTCEFTANTCIRHDRISFSDYDQMREIMTWFGEYLKAGYKAG